MTNIARSSDSGGSGKLLGRSRKSSEKKDDARSSSARAMRLIPAPERSSPPRPQGGERLTRQGNAGWGALSPT